VISCIAFGAIVVIVVCWFRRRRLLASNAVAFEVAQRASAARQAELARTVPQPYAAQSPSYVAVGGLPVGMPMGQPQYGYAQPVGVPAGMMFQPPMAFMQSAQNGYAMQNSYQQQPQQQQQLVTGQPIMVRAAAAPYQPSPAPFNCHLCNRPLPPLQFGQDFCPACGSRRVDAGGSPDAAYAAPNYGTPQPAVQMAFQPNAGYQQQQGEGQPLPPNAIYFAQPTGY
jgi:hypothetical protein